MSNPIIAEGSYAVTPSDIADLPSIAFGLYITGAGDLTYIGADGSTDTVTLPANTIWPCRVRRVLSTGTDATGIHAFVNG